MFSVLFSVILSEGRNKKWQNSKFANTFCCSRVFKLPICDCCLFLLEWIPRFDNISVSIHCAFVPLPFYVVAFFIWILPAIVHEWTVWKWNFRLLSKGELQGACVKWFRIKTGLNKTKTTTTKTIHNNRDEKEAKKKTCLKWKRKLYLSM